MKLRNKKTGEIGRLLPYGGGDGKIWVWIDNMSRPEYRYSSLAELNEEWEDAPEEPKGKWFISNNGQIHNDEEHERFREERKQIGNYFGTLEEAEKAVEKLKAWKRLKDKGFRFTWTPLVGSLDKIQGKFQIEINADMPAKWFSCDDVQKDLEDCFGGEE